MTIDIQHTCGHVFRHPAIGKFGVSTSRIREENRICPVCFKAIKPGYEVIGELVNNLSGDVNNHG